MRRFIQMIFVVVITGVAACSEKKSDSLFVFVGSVVSFDTIRDSDGFVKLKYKIFEKTYGTYSGDSIEFWASYNTDSLEFVKYKTVLLFLHGDGRTFYKLAIPWYHVYQTIDGRWADGAKWWDYTIYPTTVKPKRLQFRDSIFFDTKGMSQEQIDHWYPAKYYQIENGKAKPIFGNYTAELFELNKTGILRDFKYF